MHNEGVRCIEQQLSKTTKFTPRHNSGLTLTNCIWEITYHCFHIIINMLTKHYQLAHYNLVLPNSKNAY